MVGRNGKVHDFCYPGSQMTNKMNLKETKETTAQGKQIFSQKKNIHTVVKCDNLESRRRF